NRTQEILHALANNDFDYSTANIITLGWSKTFIDAIGLLPNPYHEYYFQTHEVLQRDLKAFKANGTRASIVRKLEDSLFHLYNQPDVHKKPKALEDRGGAFYSVVACGLMASIYNDKKDIQTVNALNKGAIPTLPYNAVIEA